MVTGATEALFAKSILLEMKQPELLIVMRTDSAAAKATVERHGAQRMKHIAKRFMYLRDLVKTKLVRLQTKSIVCNSAHILTTPSSRETS